MKPKIILKGNQKDGYILNLTSHTDKFKWDVALTHDELLEIQSVLNKKIK